MVSADGHVPCTTHILRRHRPYLDEDAVFGKRDSLVVDFEQSIRRQGRRRPRDEGAVPLGETTTSEASARPQP
jgi:hydroxyquinol 1,2-dioxygenase